jgi:hypothetical protein
MSVKSMKSMLWTNENLSLMVASSSSVSISCFKVQSSIGHLVWFFDSENSLVSEWNSWCPYNQYNQIIEEEKSWDDMLVTHKKSRGISGFAQNRNFKNSNMAWVKRYKCHIFPKILSYWRKKTFSVIW